MIIQYVFTYGLSLPACFVACYPWSKILSETKAGYYFNVKFGRSDVQVQTKFHTALFFLRFKIWAIRTAGAPHFLKLAKWVMYLRDNSYKADGKQLAYIV